MRVAKPLTDKKIRAARADKKPVLLFDGGGLYIEITPFGSKLWRLKYSLAGKDRRMALGRYPDMSLSEAREKWAEIRKLIDAGIDPLMERKEAKEQEKAARERQRNTLNFIFHGRGAMTCEA